MATESTTATITLTKGPKTYRIGNLTFVKDTPVSVAITSLTQRLVERLRGNPNFVVSMPSKKGKKTADDKGKKKSTPPPPPEDDESEDESEEGEEESEEEDESEGEEEEPSESALAAYARKDLKDLKKGELLKIAKSLKVKKVNAELSRNAIIDAIMVAQGAE
jgi:cobalamin biosynthesis protein CobT